MAVFGVSRISTKSPTHGIDQDLSVACSGLIIGGTSVLVVGRLQTSFRSR
jgi:hypothetical protein